MIQETCVLLVAGDIDSGPKAKFKTIAWPPFVVEFKMKGLEMKGMGLRLRENGSPNFQQQFETLLHTVSIKNHNLFKIVEIRGSCCLCFCAGWC